MTLTKTTTVFVPYAVMVYANKHYCADRLDMHDFKKSFGEVFSWNGKTWTCTGGIHQGGHLLQVSIREVVTKGNYYGPPNDWRNYGRDYYLGGEFKSGNQVWVMIDSEVILKPDNSPIEKIEQLKLL